MYTQFIPLLLMIAMAVGLGLTLLAAVNYVGPKRPNLIKQAAYESGMDPVGTARERYSVKFYLVAMIFIVFDVEVVFMYPWAVSFKQFLAADAGVGVLVAITLFAAILTLGLVYDVKKGGLDF